MHALYKVIFERVLEWSKVRSGSEEEEELSSVWTLIGQLQGVMVRCLQKGLRLLVQNSKLQTSALITACQLAVSKSDTFVPANFPYWSWSWWVLEELTHGGQLLASAKQGDIDISFIFECWKKMDQYTLPSEYLDGSQRVLRVIAVLAPVVDADDAGEMGTRLLHQLTHMTLSTCMISNSVSALHQLCVSKAPSEQVGFEISSSCFATLLEECERILSLVVLNPNNTDIDSLQRPLFLLGELAVVGFNPDEDKVRVDSFIFSSF